MRQSVFDLRTFYASDLGQAARRLVAQKIEEVWSDLSGLDVLAFGYATPFLDSIDFAARRRIAAMPNAQGAEAWPRGCRNRVCLTTETRLPFPNAFFDRILAVHAVEESDDPLALFHELTRILAPSGRIIMVVTERRSAWALADTTPFGHGRPFLRKQIERLFQDAQLTPLGWTRALYAPPFAAVAHWADGLEHLGARFWPGFSGVILIEAVKQTFALRPRVNPARSGTQLRPALAPVSAGLGARSTAVDQR